MSICPFKALQQHFAVSTYLSPNYLQNTGSYHYHELLADLRWHVNLNDTVLAAALPCKDMCRRSLASAACLIAVFACNSSVQPHQLVITVSQPCTGRVQLPWACLQPMLSKCCGAHLALGVANCSVVSRYSYNIATNADERRENPTPAQQRINELLLEQRMQKQFEKQGRV